MSEFHNGTKNVQFFLFVLTQVSGRVLITIPFDIAVICGASVLKGCGKNDHKIIAVIKNKIYTFVSCSYNFSIGNFFLLQIKTTR